MKYISFSLLIFLTVPALAQHFELGMDGGAARYNVLTSVAYYQPMLMPQATLKAVYVTKHYQWGAEAGYRTLSYKSTRELWGDDFTGNTPPPPVIIVYQNRYSELPLKVFMNHTVSFKQVVAYCGLFAGYTFSKTESEIANPGGGYDDAWQEKNAWVYAGAQMGVTYFVTERIGINAEAEANSNNFHTSQYVRAGNSYLAPLSIGVMYRL